MKKISQINSIIRDNGYASFVITLITIILVGLIVLGFSIDANIEQKNSLGNILSTDAYYAAESGINDAYNIVSQYINKGLPVPPGNNCNSHYYVNGKSNQLFPNPESSAPAQIYYSCLIVNPDPQNLQYQDLLPGTGTVIPVESFSLKPIQTITFSWEYHVAPGNPINLNFGGCPLPNSNSNLAANLPPLSSWQLTNCGAGVLQVDLASLSNLTNPATTIFLEPEQTNPFSTVSNKTTKLSNDQVIYVNCNQNSPANGGIYACTTTVDVSSMISSNAIYLHLIPFYEPADVSISATATSKGSSESVGLQGAQVLIDSTGYASGQYKRLQERVCDNIYCGNTNYVPASAIQSDTSICKNFVVYPGNSSSAPSPQSCN